MNTYSNTPFIVGIAGPSGCGKSTLTELLKLKISKDTLISCISLDSYYKDLEEGVERTNVNFDDPKMLDLDYFYNCIKSLRQNQPCISPVYSFILNKRLSETLTVQPSKVIILEGAYLLYEERVRNLIDLKVYVDTDLDICLLRRIKRDVNERGRTLKSVISIYESQVKPAFEEYIAPTKAFSDVIIPFWPRETALELIVKSLRDKTDFTHVLSHKCANLTVLPHTFQIRQLLTLLRDRTTTRDDFVFFTNRLSHFVVEYAFGFLPFTPLVVTTATNHSYLGLSGPSNDKICAISLMRGGECMEKGFKEVFHGNPVGKILLNFEGTNQQEWNATFNPIPNKIYAKFPHDLEKYYVFVLDPVIGRAKSSQFVVNEIKKRGVDERNICYLSLISYHKGVEELCRNYPQMRVVTIEVDSSISSEGFVIPGVGDFSKRYFGC